MPVEADKFVDALEKAYRQGRRDGFCNGQQKGSETVIIGWAEERQRLCRHVDDLCGKVMEAYAARDEAQKTLDSTTKDLGAATKMRDEIHSDNFKLILMCVGLLVSVVVLLVTR